MTKMRIEVWIDNLTNDYRTEVFDLFTLAENFYV